ncbi:hypothetical protein [Paenibacillus rigui]|uniref:Uncharacterized protein n=1 Tax=Paenibacillus rigui TaxID=554312 RepID=A0A229UQ52_9BACL|nr:hypothetical protein [Paenibacillus rigui]OXM85552.1 hypothetical protein CF651_14265 [Paenibacillus rigui]
MKHRIQWTPLKAIVLFVITACFIGGLFCYPGSFFYNHREFVPVQPQATDRNIPNDGSSFSLLYHKEQGTGWTPSVTEALQPSPAAKTSPSADPTASSPAVALSQR